MATHGPACSMMWTSDGSASRRARQTRVDKVALVDPAVSGGSLAATLGQVLDDRLEAFHLAVLRDCPLCNADGGLRALLLRLSRWVRILLGCGCFHQRGNGQVRIQAENVMCVSCGIFRNGCLCGRINVAWRPRR
eukprot:7740523-Pyramimonas_sp.AAC.1